jgi:hypothetical protein
MAAAVDVPRAGHHHRYCGPMMGRKPLIVYGRSSYGQHRCCVTAHDLLRELDRVVSGGGLLLAMCHHKTWPWREPSQIECQNSCVCTCHMSCCNPPLVKCLVRWHTVGSTSFFQPCGSPCPRDDPRFKGCHSLAERRPFFVRWVSTACMGFVRREDDTWRFVSC